MNYYVSFIAEDREAALAHTRSLRGGSTPSSVLDFIDAAIREMNHGEMVRVQAQGQLWTASAGSGFQMSNAQIAVQQMGRSEFVRSS